MKSKKLQVVVGGLALTLVGYVLTGLLPLLAGQFTVYCGAISGLVAVYCVGNVGAQVVAAKAQTDQHRDAVENGVLPPPPPEAPPEGSAVI